jgi:hypothetical protein
LSHPGPLQIPNSLSHPGPLQIPNSLSHPGPPNNRIMVMMFTTNLQYFSYIVVVSFTGGENHNSVTSLWQTLAYAYGEYTSQLIRYSRIFGSFQNSLDRGLLLTRKLLNQGYLLVKLTSSLRKLYSRHHDWVNHYGIYVLQMTTDMLHLP